MSAAGWLAKHTGRLRALSFLAVLLGLLGIVRVLPVERGVEELSHWIESLGALGPLLFGLLYVVAALLFVPGSALTLAAGALFGLWKGTVVVSLASTTAAALAFLIARHLARAQVAAAARRHPRFYALAHAIGEGGWRVIALLRLSPAVPFSMGNYLFGLTAVPFLPYALASWGAMLPGTFLYVYLGRVGRSVAQAGGRTPAQWLLLGFGLAATVAVTWYVTRLARRALRSATAQQEETMQPKHSPGGWPWGLTLGWLAGILLLGGAVVATLHRDALQGRFGPPRARLAEAYADDAATASFDHAAFEALLRVYVDEEGWVDYDGLAKEGPALNGYLDALAQARFDTLGRDEKLAFLINAYNAFTLWLILDHLPIGSIKEIEASKRWDGRTFPLLGRRLTLNQIEHEEIRPKFKEARVHFALNCASVGCPPLRREAYTGAALERQLDAQLRFCHARPRWFTFDPAAGVARLTRLYDWYGGDFRQVADSPLAFAARYDAPLAAALAEGKKVTVAWLDYDWRLNSRKNRR